MLGGKLKTNWLTTGLLTVCAGTCLTGCTTVAPRPSTAGLSRTEDHSSAPPSRIAKPARATETSEIRQTAHSLFQDEVSEDVLQPVPVEEGSDVKEKKSLSGLSDYVSLAISSNPKLGRLEYETAASWNKVPQREALPDPTFGVNAYGHPIETAAGSQWANLSIGQMIPWLRRLDAQGQQAAFEAMALERVRQAEQLRLIADVRVTYYGLYVIGQQLRINQTNQVFLELLQQTATQKVGVGQAPVGDAIAANLESSRLSEERVRLQQRLVSMKAKLNRLLNRPADSYVTVPESISPRRPNWTLDSLREATLNSQPEIQAARLRTEATAWGAQVASMRRMPDLSLRLNWYFIDDNRPASSVVDVGQDAWSIGAAVNIPLSRKKYDAMENEATWKHFAATAQVDDVERRYDTLLLDLSAKAQSASETAQLYATTILPQARQTLEADTQAYGPGNVEFDRIIRDVRNVITLEFGYHKSLGELASAIARLEQATGSELLGEEAEWPDVGKQYDE